MAYRLSLNSIPQSDPSELPTTKQLLRNSWVKFLFFPLLTSADPWVSFIWHHLLSRYFNISPTHQRTPFSILFFIIPRSISIQWKSWYRAREIFALKVCVCILSKCFFSWLFHGLAPSGIGRRRSLKCFFRPPVKIKGHTTNHHHHHHHHEVRTVLKTNLVVWVRMMTTRPKRWVRQPRRRFCSDLTFPLCWKIWRIPLWLAPKIP